MIRVFTHKNRAIVQIRKLDKILAQEEIKPEQVHRLMNQLAGSLINMAIYRARNTIMRKKSA